MIRFTASRIFNSTLSLFESTIRSVTSHSNQSKSSNGSFLSLLWTNGVRKTASTAASGASSTLLESYSAILPNGLNSRLKSGLVLWFGASTFGVGSLIVLGGMTRLTRSGLSMTEWSFTGERPPIEESDWTEEFSKYKKSPEFKRVNQNITMEDFKFIYWMEYMHRMWGRCLGVIFSAPAVYFFWKGAISSLLMKRISLLMLMGGTQGLVGWWMVKSGLQETKDDSTIPRVSPYRLATHLISAFAILSTLYWTTLSIRKPIPVLHSVIRGMVKDSNVLRTLLVPLSGMVGLTALSGAFVAGNDAGRSYNTFPMMNGAWIPEQYYTTEFSTKSHFCENTASVQLHHRILALTTGTSCAALSLWSHRLMLHPITRQYMLELGLFAVAQMGLGIAALLYHVPTWIGSAHQIGALALIVITTGTFHSLRMSPPTLFGQLLSRFGTSVAAVGVVGGALLITQMD